MRRVIVGVPAFAGLGSPNRQRRDFDATLFALGVFCMWRYTFTTFLVFSVAGAEPLRPREGTLAVGDKAPTFQLNDLATGKEVALIDAGKQPTVLIFGSCT